MIYPPEQPHLELGFYFANDKPDKFKSFIHTLQSLGGKVFGQGQVYKGYPLPAPIIFDPKTNQMSAIQRIEFEPYELDEILDAPDLVLYEVLMTNVIHITPDDVGERITHVEISSDINHTNHPLAILIEGTVFESSSSPNDVTPQIAQAGKQVVDRFLKIVDATHPSYAAITFEHPLETPPALKQHPKSISFRDFYISKDYVGQAFNNILEAYKGAYIQHTSKGAYISCSRFFNPQHIALGSPPLDIVGNAIANTI